ncbi:hypothetical protein WME94_45250 [Sorangium sp. So ce429]
MMTDDEGRDPGGCTGARGLVIDEATRARQLELVSALMGVLNLATAFAAPRYLARVDVSKPPPGAELHALFDRFLELIDQPVRQEKDSRLIEAARKLRDLLQNWSFDQIAPEPIVQTAREFMAALGISEPKEGWDRWEPPPEDGQDARGSPE